VIPRHHHKITIASHKITENHQELALVANAYARCGVSASAARLWFLDDTTIFEGLKKTNDNSISIESLFYQVSPF
jgi:hypothetical protein